jgi:predicted Zn-dependent protease
MGRRPWLRVCTLLLLPVLACQLRAAEVKDDGLLKALETEVKRALDCLGKENPPLYFLACGVTMQEGWDISASYGALTSNTHHRTSTLDIDARCGDYQRDNTHPLSGETWGGWGSHVSMPLDGDVLASRMALWGAIEESYRKAAELYAQVKAQDVTKAAMRDKSDDFSKEKPETYQGDPETVTVDAEAWAARLKRVSAVFKEYPYVYRGSASFRAGAATRTFVSSEGAKLRFGRAGYYVMLSVTSRAEDGLDLPLYKSYFAWSPDQLPDEKTILEDARRIAETVQQLRAAPLVDPYAGPAILKGEAAAVFMHEVLGHRLEGHRQKDEKESQTFRAMVGQKVMPEFLTITFDPAIKDYRGKPTAGCYPYDEQGVKGQKVVSIEKGILRQFLMGRMPIENFPNSNGHGRAQPGTLSVSRQSNMVVETSEATPVADLRGRLIEACKKRNKPYGLMFSEVAGGFTMTGRWMPNAFNVTPLVVHRVYTDGRPDELVRGVDIIGTPLTALTRIIAAGDDLSIFNGFCGAESGAVPVGAASPSLLFDEIEVQKKETSQARPPVLPPPPTEAPKKEERR